MRRSPLHRLNDSLGARFVSFGGWEMPVQYESVLTEHRAVRESAGIFDVSHLGRFSWRGAGSRKAMRRLLCNDIDLIEPGRCQYTMALRDDGGIVDDLIVWWTEDEEFWPMPNAANHERIMAIFGAESECEVSDLQSDSVFLAVQGPEAPSLIEQVVGVKPQRFRNVKVDMADGEIAMAGTGYTGEPGAEIHVDASTGEALMAAFVEAGAVPCGLGARDTLRLEAGLPLWGADIDESTTPLEAGLGFAVALDHEFVGRRRIVEQSENGVQRRLAGFVLEGRGIPRQGYEVRTQGGAEGEVTSGNISPLLDTGVGMAYISPPAEVGEEEIEVKIRNRWVSGRLARPPFHKEK